MKEYENLFVEVSEEQLIQFNDLFAKLFTTSNPKVVSINALELQTRE